MAVEKSVPRCSRLRACLLALSCLTNSAMASASDNPTISASSLPPCPEVSPRWTSSEYQLDEERRFEVQIGPFRFQVPWKYLHIRPSNRQASCRLDTDVLSFQLRIPDGTAPPPDPFYPSELTPAERREPRQPLAAGDIRIKSLHRFEDKPPPRFDGDHVRDSVIKTFGKRENVRTEGTTTEIAMRDDWTIWVKSNDEESLYFSCSGPDYCRGGVVLKPEKLSAGLFLPKATTAQHELIVPAIRRILDEWRVVD